MLITEAEYRTINGIEWRVFAYVQKDMKIVVELQVKEDYGWSMVDDHVCEDLAHAGQVWAGRWD